MIIPDAINKKIIFVTRYFYPFIGGMEKQALTLSLALADRGWRVEVLTSRVDPSWPVREEIDNISITRLPTFGLKYIGAVIFLLNLILYLYKNKNSYALIHTFQVGYTAAATIIMAKILKKEAVLKLACSGAGGDVQKHGRSWLGRVFLACCKHASAIVVLNEEMQRELTAIGYQKGKIVAIANGVDAAIYHPAENRSELRHALGFPEGKIIVYTGRILFVQKRIDWLVRAVAKIDGDQKFSLHIIGDGPDAGLLKRLCGRLRLDGRVHMLNAVASTAPFLQAADIFILPSEYEGLSNALLEAMSSGLAVVATDIPGNRDLVVDGVTGILVPPGDESMLIEAIQRLLDGGERAASMGAKAREQVCQKYSLEIMAQKHIALYGRLIKMLK